MYFFFFNDTATTEIYTLSLHDALPILIPAESRSWKKGSSQRKWCAPSRRKSRMPPMKRLRSEEHTSELQSRSDLVCRLLLEKKNKTETSTANQCQYLI